MAERNIIEFPRGWYRRRRVADLLRGEPTIFSNARRAVGGWMAATLASIRP
jgi:hypothetical protein